MRCQYCGVLQDEPQGAKTCIRCGGELAPESALQPVGRGSYLQVQMELDQVMAPAGRGVERYLLITLRTPAQLPPAEAARSESGRPPLSLTAVLDVSGSMAGEKLAQAKDAVRQALARLREEDSLSLVTFGSEVRSVLEPTAVSDQARRVITSALQEISAGGMTALCGGLELGIAKALGARRDTSLVLLLSDGQANIGETDLEQMGHRAFSARRNGLIVSTLGVGSDYNEALMVEIAMQGGGRFYHIQRANQIGAYLTGELGEAATVAARDVRIHLALPAGAVPLPLSAAYPVQQDGNQAIVAIGDIPIDSELEAPIRVALPGQPLGSKLSMEGLVTYRSPVGNDLRSILNRVTVRFVEQPAFQVRDGVVLPVAERVFEHMKAASVLEMARTAARGAPAAAEQTRADAAGLAAGLVAYAKLLGEERAETAAAEAVFGLDAMRGLAPGEAKAAVAAAFARQRGAKSFDDPGVA
jgi:Ca-activated chloride channel family protein